jgi:hypothetical protein
VAAAAVPASAPERQTPLSAAERQHRYAQGLPPRHFPSRYIGA